MFQFHDTDGLFENFEVNAEPFWPKVSRLVGGSVIFHLILIACVVFIPPVRNALSLAMVFSGGRLVDRPYKKTQIENEGDITELTTEKFHYPEGYFAMDQSPFPTPTPTPQVIVPGPFHPQPVPPAQLEPSPTASPAASASPTALAKSSPSPTVDPEEEKAAQKAEEELDRIAAENGVKRPKEINTRPFKDLLADAKKKKDRKELNLDGQIELTVEADRDPDGTLKNAKVTDKRGDKTLEKVALDFISALSSSGVLDFLEGTKHIRLTAKLDDQNVEIVASSEVESVERARQMEKGLSMLIVAGRLIKRGKDEEIYYNHTQMSSNEKEVSVKFAIPRSEFSQLLSKYTTPEK